MANSLYNNGKYCVVHCDFCDAEIMVRVDGSYNLELCKNCGDELSDPLGMTDDHIPYKDLHGVYVDNGE